MRRKPYAYVKRFLDFTLALIGLIAAAPLLILIGLLIRITMGRPVLFVQERPGLQGKPFLMYKFRTMVNLVHRRVSPFPD